VEDSAASANHCWYRAMGSITGDVESRETLLHLSPERARHIVDTSSSFDIIVGPLAGLPVRQYRPFYQSAPNLL
jgi:hypothetical protein